MEDATGNSIVLLQGRKAINYFQEMPLVEATRLLVNRHLDEIRQNSDDPHEFLRNLVSGLAPEDTVIEEWDQLGEALGRRITDVEELSHKLFDALELLMCDLAATRGETKAAESDDDEEYDWTQAF